MVVTVERKGVEEVNEVVDKYCNVMCWWSHQGIMSKQLEEKDTETGPGIGHHSPNSRLCFVRKLQDTS